MFYSFELNIFEDDEVCAAVEFYLRTVLIGTLQHVVHLNSNHLVSNKKLRWFSKML